MRAAHWYAQALPELTGLAQLTARSRIDQSVPVYLGDLPPLEVRTGAWGGVRKGTVGSENATAITVLGVHSPHGLGLHPPSGGSSHVAYQLDKRFKRLEAAAALNDTADATTSSAVTFRVVGDGKELWRSQPVQNPRVRQSFMVGVEGVTRLELFIDCPGPFFGNHAVWVEPRVMPW
jgi:hypothetical protein